MRNAERGLPTHHALIMLFDPETGAPLAGATVRVTYYGRWGQTLSTAWSDPEPVTTGVDGRYRIDVALDDRVGIASRHHIGVDNLMWSSDYPHVACTWPHSREIIERDFAHVLDRGGMRRTWLRGRENVHKRILIHVAGHNLALLICGS